MTEPRSYTIEEIASLLKVSKLTVYDLVKKREIACLSCRAANAGHRGRSRAVHRRAKRGGSRHSPCRLASDRNRSSPCHYQRPRCSARFAWGSSRQKRPLSIASHLYEQPQRVNRAVQRARGHRQRAFI
ncbi:helix-turn-helix domain-containing protein [Geobacillus icigianus]|uniref:helix-turn-helix domain-containing protein n=1 Tax=Geobacillus icigianus TaxID=1430331 RepID=UPI003898E1A2